MTSCAAAGARCGEVLANVVFSTAPDDVTTLVVGGRVVVRDGCHTDVPDLGHELEAAMSVVLGRNPDGDTCGSRECRSERSPIGD